MIHKHLLRGLVVAATVPGVLSTAVLYHQIRPAIKDIQADAAVLSALYTLPDHTLDHFQHRFSSEIDKTPSQSPSPPTEAPIPNSDPIDEEPSSFNNSDIAPGFSREESIPDDYSIPNEYQGNIIEENMSVSSSKNSLSFGKGIIKNTTSLSNQEVQTYLQQENPIQIDNNGPQVLIMHTHATESFEPYDCDIYDTRHTWRSTDNEENIVAAGEVMAQAIREYGIEVLHDDTQHDYPSYNGSYERSAVTVKKYLEQYPSIKVVLDVHRDAVQREKTLVKPVTTINGKKAAQLMIIAGCDDGTMGMPNWGKNFRFAAGMQDAIESGYPGLTRPLFFCYRKYNQDLTTGSLLLEIGSHGNTLEEVLYTSHLAGEQIGSYLKSLQSNK